MSSSRFTLLSALLFCIVGSTYGFYDREAYKAMVFDDFTNDDAIRLNPQQLIERSGFKQETYYSVADDGYVTQLIRVINPLVDRADLRPIPFLMYHGVNTDQSAYLFASSIQHHPEKWPRSQGDRPITSSNRSLAFFLANHGFDVWLVGRRGCNEGSQGFVHNVAEARAHYDTFDLADVDYSYIKTRPDKYYNYTQDELVAFELREQFDRVLQLSGAEEFGIYTFSLSTATTMMFFGRNPDYARRVRLYVQMGPAIAADHFTTFGELYFEGFCPKAPSRGIGLTPTYLGNPLFRETLLKLALVPQLRYSVVQEITNLLFGPSLIYNTNLERNVLARFFQGVSFKSLQQYCQNSLTKQLTMFDYGAVENQVRYSQTTPPLYNVSQLLVQNYGIVSGTYDGIADGTTVQRLIDTTRTPRPVNHIVVQGSNHIDFLCGTENDRYVNFPVLNLLIAAYSDEGRLKEPTIGNGQDRLRSGRLICSSSHDILAAQVSD